MPNNTTNYNLTKPLATELYDIDVHNDNNDIIDTTLFSKVDKVTGKGLSTEDFTTTEKSKLSGIQSGAEVNQNAIASVLVTGQPTITSDEESETIEFVSGSNVTITTDNTNKRITISATGELSGTIMADDVLITDIGSFFTSGSVEGALQEVGNVANLPTITKEPTGFTNNENIDVSYNSTTRTVTLTGTFEAYYRGQKVTSLISGWVSQAHADIEGNYYLYYNGSSFVFNTTPWEFDMLMIAFVQYNSHRIGVREVHGYMQWQTHKHLHDNIGAYRCEGGDFSNFVLNSTTPANRKPYISSTSVCDEDLRTNLSALTTNLYTQRYLINTGSRTFNINQPEIIPNNGSLPYWNQFNGSTWVQTLMSNNQYGAIFVVAVPMTSDATSQIYRYMFVQPQTVSTSLTAIQNITPNNLTHGDGSNLLSEFVFIGKIIIQASVSSWSIVSVEKLFGSKIGQVSVSGSFLSSVTTDNSITGSGTPTSPLSVKSTEVSATLLASSWVGSSAPFTYALTVNGVTTTSRQELLTSLAITTTENDALLNAKIVDNGQSANTINLKAFGTKPTIDIPLRIILRGDK